MAEAGTDPELQARIERYENRFHRAGLPLFDEDFDASTDVYNRAAPFLVLVAFAEVFGAIDLEFSLLGNIAAAIGGIGILLGSFGIFNKLRGRPLRSLPEDVEAPELVAFVVIPSTLPLIFSGQVTSSIVTAVGNVLLIALVYLVYAYGLPSIMRWVAKRLLTQLRGSVMLLAKAVPLLLIFALLAFINTEMWQVFADLTWAGLIAIGLLFAGLGTAFLVARLPREVEELIADVDGDRHQPLSKRQRRNVGAVLLVSQAVQVLTVALLIAFFFIVFGSIAITEDVRLAWLGEDVFNADNTIFSVNIFGQQFDATTTLIKVSAGLASFSGLYFAIAMLTDSTYREEFLEEVTSELRTVFRERGEYLRLRGRLAPEPE